MATRNVVPRANGEGSIGTALKNWLKGWFASVFVSGNLTDGTNNATVADLKDAVDKKHLESHSIASHNDTTATGTELETLTDGSNADVLHTHAGTGVVNLPDLGDVDFDSGTPADNYVLTYDSGSSKWKSEPSAVIAHEADTTNVHGITDTSDLALKSGNVNQFADITSAGADIESAVSLKHAIQHAIDSGTDHTSSITQNNLMDADANGLPDDSGLSVTDASDAISKKHTQNSDTDLDATFEDTFVKKADTVNVLSDITSAGADIEDAVTKKHLESHAISSHSDVDFDSGTPTDNDVLTYDSGSGKWKAEAGGGAAGTRDTFDNGDLSTGVLTITHSKGLSTPFTLNLTIANDSQQMVIPDEITFLTDTITVDLSSFGVLSGTWAFYYI